MRLSTALSCLLLALLTGCCTTAEKQGPPGDLILTAEDIRLKRTPYRESAVPCGEYMVHSYSTVTYSK